MRGVPSPKKGTGSMDWLAPTILWPGDDWEYSTPAQQGINMQTLQRMVDHLQEVFPAFAEICIIRNGYCIFEARNPKPKVSFRSNLIRAVHSGIARINRTPLETYKDQYNGKWNSRSIAISVISLLVGIALEKGLLKGVNAPAFEFIPEARSLKLDPAKRQITVEHLLTMTSGLKPIDANLGSFTLMTSKNWIKTCLSLPLVARPGERFIFSSANAHLLSAILTYVSSMSALEFANRFLFEPMGIYGAHWEADPHSFTNGSTNLFLSTSDLARIGYLALNDGYWNAESIVPEKWIHASLTSRRTRNQWFYYGYSWYISEEEYLGHTVRIYSASGAGGQRIFVIPEYDLVIATSSRMDFSVNRNFHLNLAIPEYILPAITL
jgi:CubicO group peptidase (beta-lactamase class C family)